MAKRFRRIGRRAGLSANLSAGRGPGRREGVLQRFLRGIVLFFRRVKRAFLALRPGGRIAALSVCGALALGIGLLIALPGGQADTEGGQLMRSGGSAAALGAADPAEVDDILVVQPSPSPSPTAAPTPTPDLTLKVGVEDSERVAELQSRLMDLGYLDIDEPTQHFGSATKYAVQLFQRQHDIQQDGIAGLQTLSLIFEPDAKKYTMVEATEGNDVENFQQQLKDLGYLSKVTGYYGSETIAAVKSFQSRNGLSADGMAGEKTLEMINSDKAKASASKANEARSKANINTMIEAAKKQVGKKYVLGKTGPDSFDCSGLVYYCLKQAGSNRRRLNAAGYSTVSDWEKISFSKLKKGDLVFFYNNTKTKVGHVGIYLGGGEMIDASSSNGKVVRRSVSTNYWKTHFVCGRRPW